MINIEINNHFSTINYLINLPVDDEVLRLV